jgi:hypothetical protein
MMIHTFDAIATSSSTPKASEVTEAISTSLMPAYAVVPLGLAGLVLIVAGRLRRRRVGNGAARKFAGAHGARPQPPGACSE